MKVPGLVTREEISNVRSMAVSVFTDFPVDVEEKLQKDKGICFSRGTVVRLAGLLPQSSPAISIPWDCTADEPQPRRGGGGDGLDLACTSNHCSRNWVQSHRAIRFRSSDFAHGSGFQTVLEPRAEHQRLSSTRKHADGGRP